MENKINIAKLLKDCPKGMELDCTMFENVTFVRVDNNRKQFPIEIAVSGLRSKYLTKEGCFHDTTLLPEAKCVIFPKGKTTWEGFHRPFKNGDIVYNRLHKVIGIYHSKEDESPCVSHCRYNEYHKTFEVLNDDIYIAKQDYRLAIEEEKQKLFDAIKANGYRWNAETKTLEKLVEPIFEVGNKIEKCGYRFTIAEVKDDYYLTKCGNKIPIDNQDDFSLVPNKFDITTLKPFDKVLVRNTNKDHWMISMFGYLSKGDKQYFMCIARSGFYQCIPYEDNQHLLGTADECDAFYKTW